MNEFWDEVLADLPTAAQAVRVALTLLIATIIGGVLGIERQQAGKEAGLRTHMLVSLGACIFVLSAREAGASSGDQARVIQGIATGIGFLGAGTIIKLTKTREIEGLTTAANIWLTAALGIAVGAGRFWLAILATVVAWCVLHVLEYWEERAGVRPHHSQPHAADEHADQKRG